MSSTSASTEKKRQPFLLEETSRPTVEKINELMRSDYMWCCISLVAHIAAEADKLGIWAECCPCAEHQMIGPAPPKVPGKKRPRFDPNGASSCSLKCCRAPELATGRAMKLQVQSLEKCVWHFTESLGNTPQQQRVELQSALGKAMGRLYGHSTYHGACFSPCQSVQCEVCSKDTF